MPQSCEMFQRCRLLFRDEPSSSYLHEKLVDKLAEKLNTWCSVDATSLLISAACC